VAVDWVVADMDAAIFAAVSPKVLDALNAGDVLDAVAPLAPDTKSTKELLESRGSNNMCVMVWCDYFSNNITILYD
jgi:hypothetical protein